MNHDDATEGTRPLTCVLFVSHPDDDAIFAGVLQARAARHRWTVVCLTHDGASPRAAEMRRWQASLGAAAGRLAFLGFPDDPEDRRQGRCSIDEAEVVAAVRRLALRPDGVVTHNGVGEYGHPHHLLVHRAARRAFPGVPTLWFGEGLDRFDVTLPSGDKWERVVAAYPSQRSVVASFARPVETFVADGDAGRALAARLTSGAR